MKYLTRLLSLACIFTLLLIDQAHALGIQEMRMMNPSPSNCMAKYLDDSQWPVVSLNQLPANSRFCLRKDIVMPRPTLEAMSLSLSMLSSSVIYWDGQLIGTNGRVGLDAESEQAGNIDVVAHIPPALLREGSHSIALDVSNFHVSDNVKSGFYGLRVMGSSEINSYILKSSISSAFILAALFVFGLLFQLLYFFYQKKSSYQLFSLLCLSSGALLLVEKWRVMFGLSYELQGVRLYSVMLFAFASNFLLPYFYLVYFKASNQRYWLVAVLVSLCASLSFGLEYDDKAIAMCFFSLLSSLGICLLAVKRKRASALSNTMIVAVALLIFLSEPTTFTEDRFALTLSAIIAVMLISLIREIRENHLQSLSSVRLKAELLKRNLQPHFLMNSLMLLIEWIEEKPDAASSFVQALAEELQMLVRFSGQSLIPIEDELALCRRHIEIMSYRYDTHYTLNVSGLGEEKEAGQRKGRGLNIPPAIIHTQIENAFSHNDIPDNARFDLEVSNNKGVTKIALASPFNGNDIKKQSSYDGMGERYIKSRLDESYFGEYRYSSHAEQDRWVNVIEFKEKT